MQEDTCWAPSARSLVPRRTLGQVSTALGFVHSPARVATGALWGPRPASALSISQSCRLPQTSSGCHNNPLALSCLGRGPEDAAGCRARSLACSPLTVCAASPGAAALPLDSSVSAPLPEPYCVTIGLQAGRTHASPESSPSPVRWGSRELCFMPKGAESQGG